MSEQITIFGMPVILDENMPPNEIRIYEKGDGHTLGLDRTGRLALLPTFKVHRITDIGTEQP